MLRWGILGPGMIAGRALAPAMRAAGHDLAVVGSRSLSRAQAFAANQGVRRARGSYEEVLEASDVDAVYIALPNDAHEQWTIAALEAGKHVLCEKPLGIDSASTARMLSVAARTGGILLEAIMSRFHPRTQALLELVGEGGIGAVRSVHAAFTFDMADSGNYRARPEHGGGALLDVGIYGVSITRWAVGEEPDRVWAIERRWASGVDGTTTALLGFPGGAVATVHASFEQARHELVEIIGTSATLSVPRPFTSFGDRDAVLLRDGESIGSWRADPYEQMVNDFAAAISDGAPLPLAPGDALGSAVVMEQVKAAAQTQAITTAHG
ncbi:MAG TPA: Gfo/Idh/MocA family oxidoreductase [Egibacteraceae bacterium]|nr:Gfo/Idh/MocA family oxidoreductase [Egibacteraceae bacterium]